MRKLLLVALTAWGSATAAVAQPGVPGFELRPVKPVVCPARPENMGTSRPALTAAALGALSRRGPAAAADITVTYNNFTPQAQAAFQYAVDIWKTQISSSVPIRINANWAALAEGVLGSAGPTTVARNFPGAPQQEVWYPIALAEKIAGQDLNGGQADISANFSSAINWYYRTDARPTARRYDLVSVVLHELCHGLGFVAGTGFDDTNSFGDYGFPGTQGGPDLPYTFATFIENKAGQRLTDTRLFVNPSAALGKQLTGEGLYFNSPLAAAVSTSPDEKRPQLYAPSVYSAGSSVSHLDELTYPAGDENSLMTYAIGAQEAIQDPGPLVRKMFDEMGWFVTAIRHTPLRDAEASRDFLVQATVQSDGTVTPGSVKLNYSVNNGALLTLPMTAGAGGVYQTTIPSPGLGATVRYYLSASDNETGRTYTAPGAPAPGVTARPVYQFAIGPDNVAPVAQHAPPAYLFANKLPFEVVVRADDNLGVASVSVPYTINGVARTAVALARQADGITYRGSIGPAGGAIVAGDVLSYRVVVTDQSARANQTVLGPYTVPIVGLKTPQSQYANSFNAASTDFVGAGFSVTQPAGFADPAIHSDHPYADQTTLTYQLLVPIVVKADPAQAAIRFDEIVLAEPGEDGAPFGSVDFYDYVVVDGSLDGETWTPLADGYDARANAKWLAAYKSATSGTSSTAVGTSALFAQRTISLRDKYPAGATVQLRFRLFADDGAHGWGWAIDNLSIQNFTVTGTRPDVLTAGGLSVYPNPAVGGQPVRVRARLPRPTAGLEVRVRNVLGQELLRRALPGSPSQLDLSLPLGALPAGIYFVSLQSGAETVTRKLVLQP